jgi:hypothetical protein
MFSGMVTISAPPAQRFLTSPFARLLGAVVGWFVYLLSFTLLVRSFVDVASVGGFCASGQSAYVIAHQCPPGATIFIPWVIFTGLIAVGLSVWLSGGFGMPLVAWAWPILFCVLGAGFLAEGYFAADLTGWLLGAMFEIMGLVPLVIALRAGAARAFIGTSNIMGQRFSEGAKARPSMMMRASANPDGAVSLRAIDVLLALILPLASACAGVYLALSWYANVAS